MKPILPTAILMMAMMGVTLGVPAAYATTTSTHPTITLYHLSITVTANGQTSTATVLVPDIDNDGIADFHVGTNLFNQIKGAFGTTTFAFPGSYTGTFTFGSSSFTVTLHSTDTFTLTFLP